MIQRVKIIVNQGRLSESAGEEQIEIALAIIETQINLMPISFYSHLETEARKRIPRDPNDWEAVALALVLSAAIWTEDYDFFLLWVCYLDDINFVTSVIWLILNFIGRFRRC
ncbi:MAG: hypothetical protein F6K23_18170 [Okeania sp. SIO2C9]|uniref:PIN domain-containing protein n=1 Tax=Okeania sp. SIO2C9 TaxID=2607791 RepID=UPI0013C24FF6|nr:PIN domain-containing protein [Okeania sp. SIO2C9]NEQ74799.1 hypothetical protein [Okeania sp. SIO2C9]